MVNGGTARRRAVRHSSPNKISGRIGAVLSLAILATREKAFTGRENPTAGKFRSVSLSRLFCFRTGDERSALRSAP